MTGACPTPRYPLLVVNRLLNIAAVLLLGLVLGLHWAALQTLAWGAMLIARVQTDPVGEAFRTTFDGQHPCRLCRFVREGQSTGRTVEYGSVQAAPDLAADGLTCVFVPSVPQPDPESWADARWVSRTSVPLVPPPRFA